MNLTVFTNRKASRGKVVNLSWAELVVRLSEPVVTDETPEEYEAMTNEQRTEVKDVGGFIGGECLKGKRSKATVMNRCLLTIDADHASPTAIEEYNQLFDYRYFCHSTHSSTASAPRLRWIFPLTRPVTAEEYRALVSIAKEWLGEDSIDETTDQPERLMFWPSISKGGHWTCQLGGADIIDPDELLKEYEIADAPPVRPQEVEQDTGPLIIPEGKRDRTLYKYACAERGRGLEYEDILAILTYAYNPHCYPPLPDEDLERIARQACKHPRGVIVPTALRDAYDDFGDLGPWRDGPRKDRVEKTKGKAGPPKLRGITFAELMALELPPLRYVVHDLITPGLNILAALPKVGKSWLAYDIAIAVASGEPVFGFETEQCAVLYLALEDGERRLQKRGQKLYSEEGKPPNLKLFYEAPGLAEDLLPAIDQEIQDCQSTLGKVGLVIIDTLQRVRGQAEKTDSMYSHDYRELGELQKYAIERDIAILVVHHKNKSKTDDESILSISGSNGVPGAVDNILLLGEGKTRTAEYRDGYLIVKGREIKEAKYHARFMEDTCRWVNLGEYIDTEPLDAEADFLNDPIVKAIMWNMDEAEDLYRISDEKTEDGPVYFTTTADLAEELRRRTGEEPPPVRAVGRTVVRILPKLEEYAGIHGERINTKNARGFRFTLVDPT